LCRTPHSVAIRDQRCGGIAWRGSAGAIGVAADPGAVRGSVINAV
jgi:hypothetical protein